jgi:prolyl-tRNA editing enzyme YbaK/EbsC (Cys-tRNA(Pro) deacylase)
MTKVTAYLNEKGIANEPLTHERAFTGIDEARALGLQADEVLKTVIVDTKAEHVAMVLPSGERLDMQLVREAVGDPSATLANEAELERDFGGFELGALPPIAPLLGIDVIVDPTVRDHGPVIFAAGTQTESTRVDAQELFSFQPVRFAQIAEIWGKGRA